MSERGPELSRRRVLQLAAAVLGLTAGFPTTLLAQPKEGEPKEKMEGKPKPKPKPKPKGDEKGGEMKGEMEGKPKPKPKPKAKPKPKPDEEKK